MSLSSSRSKTTSKVLNSIHPKKKKRGKFPKTPHILTFITLITPRFHNHFKHPVNIKVVTQNTLMFNSVIKLKVSSHSVWQSWVNNYKKLSLSMRAKKFCGRKGPYPLPLERAANTSGRNCTTSIPSKSADWLLFKKKKESNLWISTSLKNQAT